MADRGGYRGEKEREYKEGQYERLIGKRKADYTGLIIAVVIIGGIALFASAFATPAASISPQVSEFAPEYDSEVYETVYETGYRYY